MSKLILPLIACLVLAFVPNAAAGGGDDASGQPDRIIFAYGGGLNKPFLRHVITLTGKARPRICFLPTASGDSERAINRWNEHAEGESLEPAVQRVWISSYNQERTFEEILLEFDAIIVGGGNTLNMIAIWKAQGIDTVLRKALGKGIVLAGGSAGSLCWFTAGTTDSRPKELSLVEGLGFLDYSHCPHYLKEESRRPLYHRNILDGKLAPGYAMDDQAGVVFRNGRFDHAVTLNAENDAYFVSVNDGRIVERKLGARIVE